MPARAKSRIVICAYVYQEKIRERYCDVKSKKNFLNKSFPSTYTIVILDFLEFEFNRVFHWDGLELE